MRTRLAQKIPVFGQINLHFGLCPENFDFYVASGASQ
jgi:hypothetical protein